MALIETNFIRPQEVYDRNTGESKVRYRSYDGNDRFIPVVEGENGVPKTLVEVTHAELKAMRDAGKLTPGALYRITDYNCTTTQENTQSAGHQFDIVLLALSADKLAEEGWAMMHDNIYDVTFSDGVTKKCYAYFYTSDGDNYANVVDCVTMLGTGTSYEEGEIEINEQNKTMTYPNESSALIMENLTYNYFQNSNLSAWKVWYCLDNDKSRFAWADDSVDGEPASINITHPRLGETTLYRYKTDDIILNNTQYYCWYDNDATVLWTLSETPQTNDKLYHIENDEITEMQFNVDSYTPPTGTQLPNGRGVIYRLIDEWNNDVAYDFKNIQQLLPLVNETEYDEEEGVDTWVYTLDVYDLINQIHLDASIDGNKMQDLDEELVYGVACNLIEPSYTPSSNNPIQCIGRTAMITSTTDEGSFFGLKSNSIKSYIGNNPPIHILTNCNRCTIFEGSYMAILIQCSNVVLCNGCSSLREENHTMVYKISNQSNKWFITQNGQLTSLATMLDLDNL